MHPLARRLFNPKPIVEVEPLTGPMPRVGGGKYWVSRPTHIAIFPQITYNPTMWTVQIAGLLAERVAELGLSQRQFADLVGSSTKHVNLVFNGRVTAHARTLEEWARQLNATITVMIEPGDRLNDG